MGSALAPRAEGAPTGSQQRHRLAMHVPSESRFAPARRTAVLRRRSHREAVRDHFARDKAPAPLADAVHFRALVHHRTNSTQTPYALYAPARKLFRALLPVRAIA